MKLFRKRIFKYIRSFGVVQGLRIFFKVRREKHRELITFNLPGLAKPVFLRRQSSDFMVFEEIYIDHQYQVNFPENSIKTIIDAGANIGLSALYFLGKYPKASIICLEPEDNNFELLQKNLGGYSNVILVKKGLWHTKENLSFIDAAAESWGFEVKAAKNGDGQIEGISINDLVGDYNITTIDLLKMDIEGSEKEVFELNNSWINKVKHIIVEIHEDSRPGAYQAVKKLVTDHKFSSTQKGAQYFFSTPGEQHG